MRKELHLIAILMMCASRFIIATAQTTSTTTVAPNTSTPPTQLTTTTQTPPARANLDTAQYGVQIQPEARLIVMMAALDAAGFDPGPTSQTSSAFRAQVRKDQENLSADLRHRLREFYERHKLPASATTAAEQAARYVSLAYVLGPAPTFDAPASTEDLPTGALEVLDFAPLVREFYRDSGIERRLPDYLRTYQTEGERLRTPTAIMVRNVLSYLHTQPITSILERVPVSDSSAKQKKDAPRKFTTRERPRRFIIVPDLLGAPGAINFRVIADDYYAIVPPDINPASSELRRAYLQYVVDPLVVRFSRDIAARRDVLKSLLNERSTAAAKNGESITPDVFIAVARSLVAAAEARQNETAQVEVLARQTRARLERTKDATARAQILKESQEARSRIEDESIAQLADAYERGAVLAFYFADQLRGVESSGFDIASSFSDMIASFDPARERARLTEYQAARERAIAARRARKVEAASSASLPSADAALIQSLLEIEDLLRANNYEAAEARLKPLVAENPRDPRVYFAMGRVASLSASKAFDEDLRDERLKLALANYRQSVQNATPNTDPALLSRAHEAMGRILEFFDRNQEAAVEFDAAIKIGEVKGGAYNDALDGKKRVTQPK